MIALADASNRKLPVWGRLGALAAGERSIGHALEAGAAGEEDPKLHVPVPAARERQCVLSGRRKCDSHSTLGSDGSLIKQTLPIKNLAIKFPSTPRSIQTHLAVAIHGYPEPQHVSALSPIGDGLLRARKLVLQSPNLEACERRGSTAAR